MSTPTCGCNTTNIINCNCAVNLSSDCITLAEDLTCSNILKGQTFTEIIKLLDIYICERFDSVENFVTLINIGAGVEIYKGDTSLGKKQLRTLVDSGLINIVQDIDTITVSVDEVALNTFIETNQKTYTALNTGVGSEIYKSATVVGDNTQFNLRKIKSSNSTVSIVEGIDDIDITVAAGIIPDGSETKITAGANVSVSGVGTIATPYVIAATDTTYPFVSASVSGIVNNISLQELGGVDKLINGIRIGKGNLNSVNNTSIGLGALNSTTTGGEFNTAIGSYAGYSITTGISNTTVGLSSLALSTTGTNNTTMGSSALYRNITGSFNTAIGSGALTGISTSSANSMNTALGNYAGNRLDVGSDNVLIGAQLVGDLGLTNGNANTIIGKVGSSHTTGSNNTLVGRWTSTTSVLNNNIVIADGSGIVGVQKLSDNTLLAPTQTNALIIAEPTGKAIITKEYLTSVLPPALDGSETKINSGVTTTVTGTGTIATPYVVETVNLQKVITYPTDFTGINYTLTNTDNNYEIIIDNGATAVTITVPSGLTSKIGIGFTQKGTADVEYLASATTINNPTGLKIKGQYYQTFLSQELNTNNYFLGGSTKI